RTEPKPPSQVAAIHIPPELEQVIMTCLAKQPSDRPSSAAALEAQLRALPDPGDWGDADASRWWDQRRDQLAAEEAVADAQTITVTIDLEERTPATPVRHPTVRPLR